MLYISQKLYLYFVFPFFKKKNRYVDIFCYLCDVSAVAEPLCTEAHLPVEECGQLLFQLPVDAFIDRFGCAHVLLRLQWTRGQR